MRQPLGPNGLRIAFLGLASALVASCGINIPDARSIAATCDRYVASPPANADASVYFVSTAVPQCRPDKDARFLGFRNHQETYGVGHYSTSEKPKKIEPVIEIEQRAVWIDQLKRDVANSGGKLTVFIHGYNNTFVDAFRRGAAISKLYDREVPVVVINWPSRAKVAGYTVDEASIAWAQDSISTRLAELTTFADKITVVAHSMGTRAAIKGTLALDRMDKVIVPGMASAQTVHPDAIKRIVLASGDIDRDQVLRVGGSIDQLIKKKPWSVEPELDPRREVLVYASYRDTPIQFSRRLHGYARLGTTSCKHDVEYELHRLGSEGNCHRTLDRQGLTVVSTSKIDEDGKLNHADFIDSCRTKAHLKAFLTDREPRPYELELSDNTEQRWGYEIDTKGGPECVDEDDKDED